MDIGLVELLLFFVPVWGLTAFVCYWIIRLAVRHGIQDTHRRVRVDRATAGIGETIRRQQATYGGTEPE
jgi:hypothetical protein